MNLKIKAEFLTDDILKKVNELGALLKEQSGDLNEYNCICHAVDDINNQIAMLTEYVEL